MSTQTDNFALPIPDNRPEQEQSGYAAILAVRNALIEIDTLLKNHATAIGGKADGDATWEIADIDGLAAALAGKMAASKTFALKDMTDTAGVADAITGYVLAMMPGGKWSPASAQSLIGEHQHLMSDVQGLAAALAQKANTADLGNASGRDVGTTAGTVAAGDDSRITSSISSLFSKSDPYSVAFTKTGAGSLSVRAGTTVEVNGDIITFATDTAITMPSLVAGTDYAIWVHPDGSISASSNHVSPPVANARKIGGAHYAPGGNATARAGGNSTPQFNEFSLWDLKFRPACPDPRGMALVAGGFWCDIYLLGVNHHSDGTSRYNVTIADGSSPPKIPAMFGGNGATVYGSLNWWEAAEVMQSHGKDLPSYAEFAAAAYGVKEAQSGGTDPVSTILRADYTSIWGIMLASGNLWVWGRDFGGNFAAASWAANTGGRGSTNTLSNVALFGGGWGDAAYSGSRASRWYSLPTNSFDYFGARGRSDHMVSM